jgi:hypothetical protein
LANFVLLPWKDCVGFLSLRRKYQEMFPISTNNGGPRDKRLESLSDLSASFAFHGKVKVVGIEIPDWEISLCD